MQHQMSLLLCRNLTSQPVGPVRLIALEEDGSPRIVDINSGAPPLKGQPDVELYRISAEETDELLDPSSSPLRN